MVKKKGKGNKRKRGEAYYKSKKEKVKSKKEKRKREREKEKGKRKKGRGKVKSKKVKIKLERRRGKAKIKKEKGKSKRKKVKLKREREKGKIKKEKGKVKKVKSKKEKGKKGEKESQKKSKSRIYYSLNTNFAFIRELRDLILTPLPSHFKKLGRRIAGLGKVRLALVSGVFLNKENVADLLIVGNDIDKRKLRKLLKSLEAEIGTQIIYAVMDLDEFNYRKAMFDRFIRLLLEGPHRVLIDKIGL